MKELREKFHIVLESHKQGNLSDKYLVDAMIVEVENYELRKDKFTPPEIADLTNYIMEKELMPTLTIHDISEISKLFSDYYESVGWVVGKEKKQMKSWKKAMNNWCKRNWNSKAKAKMNESIKAHLLIQQQISNQN